MKKAILPLCLALSVSALAAPPAKTTKPVLSPMQRVFARAKANRAQIELAWKQTPPAQRAAMQFLLENAPDSDLQTLSASFLRSQVQIAFEARAASPWKTRVSDALFFNDVVPYAALDEIRDDSRQSLRKLALPLIAGLKSPGEAALVINRQLFPMVKVKYSTAREKPDQSPLESMKSGLASCSGLSILLVDACRSVGIPARIAGTPMWSDGRGNHTWVEVWDDGWHFIGAAEADGLDKGWFVGDTQKANTGKPENGIYASSWKQTDTYFPMVWNEKYRGIGAQNVTARYAPTAPAIDTSKSRLMIVLLDPKGARLPAKISATDANSKPLGDGQTRGETADANDFLEILAPRGAAVTLSVEVDGKTYAVPARAADAAQTRLTMRVQSPGLAPRLFVPIPTVVAPEVKPLAPATAARVEAAARVFFSPDATFQRVSRENEAFLDQALLENEPAVRAVVWQAFKASNQANLKADFDQNLVRNGEYVSPFTIRTIGTRPKNGWGLVIAMHGGGNAPKELNDSQWKIMETHYRDHPEMGGYKLLALRAPNDTWNGFYDDYVYPLIENLVRAQTGFGDVDPARVYLIGYSHGGYGAYSIGPKIPDRFAFIHASAGAVTDGQTLPPTLRNTPFTAMVGEFDTDYGRLERNQRFAGEVDKARGNGTDFPVRIDVMAGFQHPNLPDRDEFVEMMRATRNPVPHHLTWTQTDGVVKNFFFLQDDAPAKSHEIDATITGNDVTVQTVGEVKNAALLLDARLIDFSKPLQLSINGKASQLKVQPSFNTLCQTMARRGDPDLAFSARVAIGQ